MLFFAVLFSMISASMVLSKGEHQEAVCARNPESIGYDDYLIDNNYRTMDHVGPIGDLKHCEVQGTFVFYSEENYKGRIKYARDGTNKTVNEMLPEDSSLTRIQSVRIAGNHEKWYADTITFYEDEDFSGDDEMYDDVNSSADHLNNPGSAIVTGLSDRPWSVYAENGKCYELKQFYPPEGLAGFYRSLKQEVTEGSNIERVEKGYCRPEFK